MPETNDKRTLIAAAHVLQEGLANIIMVGNEEKIMDGAGWLEVDLTGVKAVSYTHLDVYKRQAAFYVLDDGNKAAGTASNRYDGSGFVALAFAVSPNEVWLFVPEGFMTREYLVQRLGELTRDVYKRQE